MRPRNAREREVVKLSRKLSGLSDAQVLWCVDSIVPHIIHTSGKKCWCTACGHVFEAKDLGETHECPHCHRTCKVERDRKSICHGFEYVQVITTRKGWQVVRYFLFRWYSKKGLNLHTYSMPVMEKWCRPGQRMITLAAATKFAPYWQQQPYSEYSALSVKYPSYFNTEWMRLRIYPRMSILPTYYKCGFTKGMFKLYCAEDIFGKVFAVPHFEALYKAGEIVELEKKMKDAELFSRYWPSVRIALRHGFDPYKRMEYVSNYWDYLGMLKYLRKDMRSPRYVAPQDWDDIHRRISDEAQKKRQKAYEAQQRREAIRRAQAEEERLKQEKAGRRSFTRRMKKFAGLLIVGDGLSIAPLMTIKEFADEGAAMHHCVFSGAYYKKKDSLILSAKDNTGKRVETIEVSLRSWTILQAFGVNNSLTNRHDDIISLVTENMGAIQALTARKSARS